jgi:hypothetical protein
MVENPERGIAEAGQTVAWTIKTCPHHELILCPDGLYRCRDCGEVAEVRFLDG